MGLVALVLLVAVGTAHGSWSFTTSGSGVGPNVTLQAKATFAVSNLYLIVTLSNEGTYDSRIPADILTTVLFKINGGSPQLTPVSAELGPDSSVIAHRLPMGFDGDVGSEWAYRDSFTNAPEEAISSTNLKGFGNKKYLFPGEKIRGAGHLGGVDFGLTTINDNYLNDTGGLKNKGLIVDTVVFTFKLPSAFTVTNITDVTFQYGTNLKQPDLFQETADSSSLIPEPSTISLVAAALLGALTLARRRPLRR
jgi:hypothetical protein